MMRGVDEMVNLLKRVASKFPDRVSAAMYAEAEIMMTESKRRCPVGPVGAKKRKNEVPGALRASGRVGVPEREGRRISVTLSYGGGVIDAYAIAVHEHLSEHSPPSWVKAEQNGDGIEWTQPGTGPKFLESVVNEAKDTMAERIANRIHFDHGDSKAD